MALHLVSLASVLVILATGPRAHAGPGEDAKVAYREGQRARGDAEKRKHYKRGLELARRALARNPNDPAGLLWYAGNLGAEALTHGKLYALRHIAEIERTLLRLEALHPTYDHAAAARSLGRLYHKAPAVISVGSNARAAQFLGKALARAPEFPGNWAFAADFYADRGDCARARPLAERLRRHPGLDAFGFDAKEWREIAVDVIEDECD